MTPSKCDIANSPLEQPQNNSESLGQPKQLDARSYSFPQSSAGNFERNRPAYEYEGYTYSQADPVPGQSAPWTRAERIDMKCSQHELHYLVQKRGSKKSVMQQYQNLSSNDKRAHIMQLIREQRRRHPQVEWTFVYAKEITQPSQAPNARYGECETVQMNVILLKMPKNQMYTRSKVGVPVARPSGPGMETSHWTKRDQIVAPDKSTSFDIAMEGLVLGPINRSETSFDNSSDWSSHGSSDEYADSNLSEESKETSESEDSESTYNGNQEGRPWRPYVRQQPGIPQPGSPRGRAPSPTRGKPDSHSFDRRQERSIPLRGNYEVPAVKTPDPKQFDRARSHRSTSGRRVRMQPISDNETRSQLLDNREANIEHREKRLKRTYVEALQPEQRQSVSETVTPVCRCTCRCAVKNQREAA